MDENLHNIEDLFKDGLEDNEDMPSPQAWVGIDNALDKENVVSIKKKYTAMKRLSVLLLLLLFSVSIYELANRHSAKEIAKGNTNDANTKTVSRDNYIINGQSPTVPPKKIIDTVSLGNKNKSTTNLDAPIAIITDDKNNLQSTAGNKSKIVANKDLTASTKNVYIQNNNSIENMKVDDNKADDKIKLNNTIKPQRKLTITANNKNTIAVNIASAKNKRNLTTKGKYRVSVNNVEVTDGEQQVTVTDDAPEITLPFNGLKRLAPLTIETINRQLSGTIATKKLVPLFVADKVPSFIVTKKNVAASTKNKINRPSKFSIAPFFSPDIAWYNLQEDKTNNQPDNLAEIERSEKHEFSLTAGVLADYRLAKHWSLQSGVTYSNTNITVKPQTIYAQNDNAGTVKYRINTSSGYGYVLPSFSSSPAIGDSLYAFTAAHSINYIGVPLSLKYNIAKGKFNFNVMTGFSTNFLTGGKIETSIENGFNSETEVVNNLQGLKKIYFTGLAGVGVDYSINKRIALSFAPTYRFALSAINQNTAVKSYPNSLGLLIGLKIGL